MQYMRILLSAVGITCKAQVIIEHAPGSRILHLSNKGVCRDMFVCMDI